MIDRNFKSPLVIGFPHRPDSIGGGGTFQTYFTKSLLARGHKIVYPDDAETPNIVLVVGGTRNLQWLRRCKHKGSKIIYRLDGINWRHRYQSTPFRVRWLAGARNLLMRIIRDRFADLVVYQSLFVKVWWERWYGKSRCPAHVIYNGVDLSVFRPRDSAKGEAGPPVILCVEGNISDDSSTSKTLNGISEPLLKEGKVKSVLVCGGTSSGFRKRISGISGLHLLGAIPRERMPEIFCGASLFLNLEVNPPCPNSVLEALAAGVPVAGFDTGALSELVSPEAGALVPYGGDPWKLEEPDVPALLAAVREMLARLPDLSGKARAAAEERFSVGRMTDEYLSAMTAVLEQP